jgi:DNA end-binding protein Ku
MQEKNRHALARIILSGHNQTVLIRPLEKVMAMTVLYYHEQVKQPAAFEDEVGHAKITAQELKLGATLMDASTPEKFDFAQYKDEYTQRVAQLVEAKMVGKKVAAPRRERAPHVINLMDALRKSLGETGKARRSKMAAGVHRHERAHARRKTG